MTPTRPPVRRPWWLAIAFVFALQLVLVPPARACSCAQPGQMATYRGDPNVAIFTAIVEPRDARGFPVIVTRWFHGGLPAPRVWFDAGGFTGDGASCGVAPLPVLTEWIFVAYRIEGRQELGTGLCSPHAPLTGPDGATGKAMLADAATTFGGAPPVPTTTPGPAAPAGAATSIVPFVVGVIAILGLFTGLVAVLRARRPL